MPDDDWFTQHDQPDPRASLAAKVPAFAGAAGGPASPNRQGQQDWFAAHDSDPQFQMVGPDGGAVKVSADGVQAARRANFALTQQPGVSKMVSPQGQVNYVLPSEVSSFKGAGHTLIAPDGSFSLQNISGEDPLEEQKRYQRVYRALTPQEQRGAVSSEVKTAGKAGLQAVLATAGGVAGASAMGAASESIGSFLTDLGAEIGKKFAGQTAAKITADFLTENAGKLALGGGSGALGGYLVHKWSQK